MDKIVFPMTKDDFEEFEKTHIIFNESLNTDSKRRIIEDALLAYAKVNKNPIIKNVCYQVIYELKSQEIIEDIDIL